VQQRRSDPNLQSSKRSLKDLHKVVLKNEKPSPTHIKNLNKAAKQLRNVPMRMPELDNQLWDIEDYVESPLRVTGVTRYCHEARVLAPPWGVLTSMSGRHGGPNAASPEVAGLARAE
jgi:hypothetical protein